MYRNFIFDLYGTLLDIRTDEGSPEVWEAYARWLADQGYHYGGRSELWADSESGKLRDGRESENMSAGECVHALYDREVRHLTEQATPYRYPEIDILPVFRAILEEGLLQTNPDGKQFTPDGEQFTPDGGQFTSDGGQFTSQEGEVNPKGKHSVQTSTEAIADEKALVGQLSDEEVYRAGEQFRIISTKFIRPYPNTLKVLDGLHAAGCRVYLLSNAQHVFTWQELVKTDLVDRLDDIFISSDAGVKKPDPAFYEMLFARHGLAKEESIMIGNDSTCDVAGAQAYGIDAAYVRTAISPENDPRPDCRYVWDDGDIGHVLELVKK